MSFTPLCVHRDSVSPLKRLLCPPIMHCKQSGACPLNLLSTPSRCQHPTPYHVLCCPVPQVGCMEVPLRLNWHSTIRGRSGSDSPDPADFKIRISVRFRPFTISLKVVHRATGFLYRTQMSYSTTHGGDACWWGHSLPLPAPATPVYKFLDSQDQLPLHFPSTQPVSPTPTVPPRPPPKKYVPDPASIFPADCLSYAAFDNTAPVVTLPAPAVAPATRPSASKPALQAPTSKPASRATAPVHYTSAPLPAYHPPAPKRVYHAPAPKPVHHAPAPARRAAAPLPAYHPPAPQPTYSSYSPPVTSNYNNDFSSMIALDLAMAGIPMPIPAGASPFVAFEIAMFDAIDMSGGNGW